MINKPKDLIVSYLLRSPRKSIVQINERGGSGYFIPTKRKILVTQTFSGFSHKKSKYPGRSSSTYRNVCQFSEPLRLAACRIKNNFKCCNVYESTRLLTIVIRGGLSRNIGGGPNFKLAVSRVSKFIKIFPCGIQWPSNKDATHQEKLTNKLQWPPEKVATMWTVANSS